MDGYARVQMGYVTHGYVYVCQGVAGIRQHLVAHAYLCLMIDRPTMLWQVQLQPGGISSA